MQGEQHKYWLLDQIVRVLTEIDYDLWVKKYETGKHGPKTYEWDTGIAP